MEQIRFFPIEKPPNGFSKARTLKSPAKINLYLAVVGKRTDGYHLLQSVMAPLTICDEVTILVRKTTDKPAFYLIAPDDLCSEQNILFKTFKKFLVSVGSFKFDLCVHLKKRVPQGGGLGGGSSNAGILLSHLNALLPRSLSKRKLIKISSEIGADVPFFLESKPALVEGIGEKLRNLKILPRRKIPLILVNPGINVSTRLIFEALGPDAWSGETKVWRDLKRTGVLKLTDSSELLNDLEKVAFPLYPEISTLVQGLNRQGALFSRMSGSGSTVFGVFESEEKAARSYRLLKNTLPAHYWVQKTEIVH